MMKKYLSSLNVRSSNVSSYYLISETLKSIRLFGGENFQKHCSLHRIANNGAWPVFLQHFFIYQLQFGQDVLISTFYFNFNFKSMCGLTFRAWPASIPHHRQCTNVRPQYFFLQLRKTTQHQFFVQHLKLLKFFSFK